ncbi:MAG: adenylate/guanylate cyclase domain-containing protein [Bacteroidia bacterium]|nr:adenylate/guanylate cyclase domain-containing protein [Bacteroidia bacterium]
MNSKRQLAAILFADIAGYTALMQENEQQALRVLNHFREDIESIVPQFNGQIIQFYGDGCLIIFNSVVIALHCSIALQKSLKTPPKAPVRIGLHQGDILKEGGNIFGNSVNIAARIESMSIPGAVLLSEKVQSELKNQQDVPLTSLGHFEFKNVGHPIEVFAIAKDGFPIPRKNEIQGKFKTQSQEKSIAVLAFENRSSDPEQEYFSDGISEEIIYGLSQLDNLKVAGRKSSFSFKNSQRSSKEIGDELQVENILEGSVQKMGNKVRIRVQLVNAQDGFQIWTERFDRELEDIFSVQEEIAKEVVHKMKLSLLGNEKAKNFTSTKTHNVEAYQLYLEGRSYLDKRINIDLALNCFSNAIEIDPEFAAAYSSLAYAHFYKVTFTNHSPLAGFPQVEHAAQKALQIDSSIAEAHTMQGLVDFYFHYKFEKARQQYEEALLLQPNFADTYRVKAYFHSMLMEEHAAIANAERSFSMEPLSFNNHYSLADIYYRACQYDKAIDISRSLVQKYPESMAAKELLANAYFASENVSKAGEIFEKIQGFPKHISIYSSGRFLYAAQKGNEELCRNLLEHIAKEEKTIWISPGFQALMHLAIGEQKSALEILCRAYEERDPALLIIRCDPMWKQYRDQPEIQKITKQIPY